MPSPMLLHIMARSSFGVGLIPSSDKRITYIAARLIKRKTKKGTANAIPEKFRCQYNVNEAKTAPKKLMISAPQAPLIFSLHLRNGGVGLAREIVEID